MRKISSLEAQFVTTIPQKLEEGTIYVSMEYATVVHLCCCGCGMKTSTPLTPTDWTLTYNGQGVSMHPSIGNWGFPCRSHYWIKNGKVQWAEDWSTKRIRANRKQDHRTKAKYFNNMEQERTESNSGNSKKTSIWKKITHWFQS